MCKGLGNILGYGRVRAWFKGGVRVRVRAVVRAGVGVRAYVRAVIGVRAGVSCGYSWGLVLG